MRSTKWRRMAAVGAALVLVAAACGDDDDGDTTDTTSPGTEAPSGDEPDGDAAPAAVTALASDFAFEVPAQVPAGAVALTVQNDGAQIHHGQIVRLAADTVAQDIVDAVASAPEGSSEGDIAGIEAWLGGPNVAFPGGATSGAITGELEPGNYALICVIPDDETGAPHVALGMAADFEVTESDTPAAAPEADHEIVLADFSFDVPEDFDGQGTVAFTNSGPQLHEAVLVKGAEGATAEDIEAFFLPPPDAPPAEGPPPLAPAIGPGGPIGGITLIESGDSGYNEMALEPGLYALYCFVSNTDETAGDLGLPHALLGMQTTFEIT